METNEVAFNLTSTIQQIKKYLPSQGPLKDYVFLNSLQSFQDQPFHEAMKRSEYSFYILSLKDWNLESIIYQIFLRPLKRISLKIKFLHGNTILYVFVLLFISGIFIISNKSIVPPLFLKYLPSFYAFIGLMMVIKAFTERRKVVLSWFMIMMNHFWIAIAIGINDSVKLSTLSMYLFGVILSGIIGYFVIRSLRKGLALVRMYARLFLGPHVKTYYSIAYKSS